MISGPVEVMERGMQCLIDGLGYIEAEQFITLVNRERFDYTEWRKRYFGNMSAEEFNDAAVQYAQEHPFKGRRLD